MVNILHGFASKEKTDKEKLSRPEDIPELVKKYLNAEHKVSFESLSFLQSVKRGNGNGEKSYDIRIYDPLDASEKKVKISDYYSFNDNTDLLLYEGSYSEKTKQVQLNVLRKVADDIKLYTEQEMVSQIEALKETGSSVFFYLSSSPASGGPLGRGAAVVELTSDIPGKKRRYTIFTADVVNVQPVNKGTKLWDSEKPKDIAKWIKERHNKRER